MTTVNMNPPNTAVITAKGTKGFLLWVQQTMPDFYAVLSPQLIATQKAAVKTLKGMACAPGSLMYGGSLRGFGTLGDDSDLTIDDSSYTTDALDTASNPAFSTDLTISPSSNTTNAASVAGTGPTSNSLASAISAIAGAVGVGTIAAAQVSANNTLLQTNLARAQQGLPPLTATTANGTISVGNSSTLLILGAGLLAVLLLSKKGGAAP